MKEEPAKSYLDPSDANVASLLARDIRGEVMMLNLLRFRATADYSQYPELAPKTPISGYEAYEKYVRHTLPFLHASGGELVYMGTGGQYLIGPVNEGWDAVMLVKQKSVESFFAFASNANYMAGIGHRVAALSDSRILPLAESVGAYSSKG